ncbi:MAG: HlyD family efflux transporter periplasmic adaptor subunit, partial [Acidobacteria bacterium]|nr:HlyD family efflux transporter periplasmic adaptor subunit [Acidobacteriota bacterium]
QCGSTRSSRVLGWLLALMLATVMFALTLTPWQQNVVATGQVVAFNPVERRQFVEAPISGRVVQWNVVEGETVTKGEVLLEISDNDPFYVDRMEAERSATDGIRSAELRKASSYREKMQRLELTRDRAIAAAESKIAVADDKIKAAERAVEAAEAAEATAKLNIDRQLRLHDRGLSSRRNYELAELTFNQSVASANKSRADLAAERNNRLALLAEREKIDADSQSKVEDARASFESALSSVQKATADLTKVDVRLARQSTQVVRAPIDGVVLRITARQGSEMVKSGDPLMELVPVSSLNVVELWVDGNDAPLVSPGRKVRLQFEGWPALQFSGWPSIAVGTFAGEVMLVDASDDGRGKFRALVRPDPEDGDWPEKRYLRQGVRTNGWILLDRVSLGFELWRQFNGFPPVTTAPHLEPQTAGSKEKKG